MLSGGTGSEGGRRCAVLGHPVAHSLSPLLHRTAYDLLGLGWSYQAHDVTEAALAGFLAGLDGSWRGLSLTMPLKRAVLPLLDTVDDTARTVGAANTVLLSPDGRHGVNTDVSGLVTALREAGLTPDATRAVVLGGGATAGSTLGSLATLGVGSVELRVREPARAAETLRIGRRLGLEVSLQGLEDRWPERPAPAVVVSTVPSGVAVEVLPDPVLAQAVVVVDVRYDPWPSPLLERANRLGASTASGIELLVHQALDQLRLMTGAVVPAEPLRAAALAALRRRAEG